MTTYKISARAADPNPSSRALPWPVLEAGNASFPEGEYSVTCENKETGQSFTLRHQVQGAPLIERWLDEGKVEYVCTVAAPRSMYRKLHKSGTPEQVIAWQQRDLGEFPMFTPMLVAREDIQHVAVAESDGLNPLWNGRELNLHPGARIAVGPTFKFQSGIAGILDFVEDKDLPDGQLRVIASNEDGFKFKVHLATNLHRHLEFHRNDAAGKNIMVHIVSAAFSLLQRELDDDDEEEGGWQSFPNLLALADLLRERGIPHWAEDGFQPEGAATKLYPHIIALEDV